MENYVFTLDSDPFLGLYAGIFFFLFWVGVFYRNVGLAIISIIIFFIILIINGLLADSGVTLESLF